MNEIFFIDRCLGKKLVADSLRNVGATVKIHDDHFKQDIEDKDWLRIVGEHNWVVLTKDKNIANRSLELEAVAEGNVRLFALVDGNVRGVVMAQAFVNALENMQRFIRGNQAPFIAKVHQSGLVKPCKNQKELLKMFPKTTSQIHLP
ncbi:MULTISPECIES: PIN-like domain-containing protein [unclassified Microcoleus]|uniref:PIN-like domain-containing protein n=1 Tax=unclassified Microcoleus TaxID=2642155 RepID=UPI002FD49770